MGKNFIIHFYKKQLIEKSTEISEIVHFLRVQ